jgi:hypothetical protein
VFLSRGGMGERIAGVKRTSCTSVRCSFRKGGRAVLGLVGEAREGSSSGFGPGRGLGGGFGRCVEKGSGLADTR